MSTTEEDYCCWVLDEPFGDGEDGTHFRTAEDAMESARFYHPQGDTAVARQLPSACFNVVCDAPGCGVELENIGEGFTVHLSNPADDANTAAAEGWTVAEDGTLTCYECAETDPAEASS